MLHLEITPKNTLWGSNLTVWLPLNTPIAHSFYRKFRKAHSRD